MLTDKKIGELFTLDYEEFVDTLLKEVASLSIDKNLLDDLIEVSVDPIKSDLILAISTIRDEKIRNILNDKNEEC
jgi:hypothetical protein